MAKTKKKSTAKNFAICQKRKLIHVDENLKLSDNAIKTEKLDFNNELQEILSNETVDLPPLQFSPNAAKELLDNFMSKSNFQNQSNQGAVYLAICLHFLFLMNLIF